MEWKGQVGTVSLDYPIRMATCRVQHQSNFAQPRKCLPIPGNIAALNALEVLPAIAPHPSHLGRCQASILSLKLKNMCNSRGFEKSTATEK